MKRTFLMPVLLASSAAVALCQPVLPPNIRATNTLDRLLDFDGINNYDILYGIPMDESKRVIGDSYLDSEWQKASILLTDQKLLEGYLIRFDIRANEIEIKTQQGIKVLPARFVRSFITIDSLSHAAKYFLNASPFRGDDGALTDGFFQVLTDGAMPLVKKTLLEIKKADYKVQFSMGSKEDKILKKEKYFYMKGNVFYEMPMKKKRLMDVFGDQSGEAESFIKTNGLTLKQEDHLKAIFEHYNKLIKS